MKRWQQNALILSCAWAFGTTAYLRYQELPKAQEYAMHAYYVCAERMAASGKGNFDPCLQNVDKDWNAWMNRKWGKIAAVALLPVALGWLATFAGLFAYRRFRPDLADKDKSQIREPE